MISGFGYRITVQMTSGSWVTMGKMDATISYSMNSGEVARPKVTLQPHMIKIEAGKAYSGVVETQYPVDGLYGIRLHWRGKSPLGDVISRRSILVDKVTIEPLYLLGDERIAKTQVWCTSDKSSVKIKRGSTGYFFQEC